MSYCTAADVTADFKNVDFTTTNALVKTAAVTQFIVEAGALINAYVGQRYVTPVTADTDSLALMSLFCRTLVADRVRGILENKQQTNIDGNQNVKADGFCTSDVMKALNAIKNNEMNLSGATLNNPTGNFYSNNQVGSVEGKFKKNTKQW